MRTGSLSVEELVLGYGQVRVLEKMSMTVPAGRVHCVLGPNGAGKSTLLRGISGMLRPTAGTVSFDGADITRRRPEQIARMGLAHVAEGRRIFRKQSVDINLRLGCQALGVPSPVLAERLDRARTLFPVLAERRSSPAGALSGGQQQMLAIAQAMMRGPSVLMLDEPSLGLSPMLVDVVFSALQAIRADGCTIILVEQFVDRALGLADDVSVLRAGRVIARGPAADFDAETVRGIYLGALS